MRVAIVGAGICGLAVAWYHLQKYPHAKITIFDIKGIGAGASGVAAGLLHPFTGAHAKFHRFGHEGMQASLELLKIASNALAKPVYDQSGIIRPAISDLQTDDFMACHHLHPTLTTWLSTDQTQSLCPGMSKFPSLLIHQGINVHCKNYIQGLWKACEALGAHFEIAKISHLSQLSHFDKRFITVGAWTQDISDLSHLSIRRVKGQLLELTWPDDLKTPSIPINSRAYLIVDQHQKSCIVGATFEKNYDGLEPEIESAKNELLPLATLLYKELRDSHVLGCQAGIRAVTADRLPLAQFINPSTAVLTGMGSKGLLLHALFAKRLVDFSS